jgi:hypothetical protein
VQEKEKTDGYSARNYRIIITLVLLALFAPSIIGFQYLEWLSGNTHFTFLISSTIWNLTYSDWYFEVPDAINGWLFTPIIWLYILFLVDVVWAFGHVTPVSLLIFLLTPIVRLFFVAVVILYTKKRISKSVLAISSISVIGVSLANCLFSMIVNVIYGIPPGLRISIAAPDVDTRLFIPIPILFLVGLYLSRKAD